MKHKIGLIGLTVIAGALLLSSCNKPKPGAQVTKPGAQLSVDEMKKMTAVIETNFGTIKFKFYPDKAPNTCRNFISLAQKGFYNNLIFHRVIQGFMIQGGDPNGNGSGGPGYAIDAEFSNQPHLKGTVSMARESGNINSAGSQFFICLEPQPMLDGQYTVFGQVTEGQEVVDKIGSLPTQYERPMQDAVMKKVYIIE